jgi:hypothetical protein
LLKPDAPAPGASSTNLRATPPLSAPARTTSAAVEALVDELLRAAENTLLERDRDFFADVSAVAGSDSEGTEDVAEEAVQPERPEVVEVGTARTFEEARTEAVVSAAFFFVVEDLVRGVDGREARLCAGVTGIPVRVVLRR